MTDFLSRITLSILLLFTLTEFVSADDYKAKKAAVAPTINGLEDDACWSTVPWSSLTQIWVPAKGTTGTPEDFTGAYKAVWTEEKLYILMKVTDDTLINWRPTEPLNNYWNNDCPEIFIDENHSKGEHQCNYNAFAYHISTLFDAVDSDPNCNAQLFKDVVTAQRTRVGNTYMWEFAMNVYTDKYQLNATNNPKATLFEGKIMGFSIAYNDSDQNQTREKMYGSQVITATDPNVSYINADYFGTMELVASVTGLDGGTNVEEATIFPNPSDELISFQFGQNSYDFLKLFNAAGNEIYSAKVTGKSVESLNVRNLTSGVYFVQLQGKEYSHKKKIIIK